MTEYFISYAHEDGADFADNLRNDLVGDKYKVWFDKRNLAGGAIWDDEIESALANCEALLLVITPASTVSQNVKDEWGYVLDAGKPVIPLMLIEAEVPFRVRRRQYIDFRDGYDKGLAELLQLLKDLKKKSP